MNKIHQEKKVLEELVKAREAVKRKYNLIKNHKNYTGQILNETFKPIVELLEKLVQKKKYKPNKKSFSILQKQDESIKQEDGGENELFEQGPFDLSHPYKVKLNISADEEANKTFEKEEQDTATNEPEKTVINSEKESVIEVPDVDRDKVYRLHFDKNGYKLGSAVIKFQKDKILINNTSYPRTPGLYELIIHKQPKNYNISDLTSYKKILEQCGAHKKPDGQIKKHSSSIKYKEIIGPLFLSAQSISTPIRRSPLKTYKKAGLNRKSPLTNVPPAKVGGSIPQFKIARVGTKFNYVYWDDPNELVERLRLLIAEQSAGNTSHTNEIHSIIEELREGGYIY